MSLLSRLLGLSPIQKHKIHVVLFLCVAHALLLHVLLGAHLASKVQAETLKIVVCAVLVVSAVALLTQLGVTEAQ